MAIAIIIHAAIFSDNPDMLATAGSVSSGVTGVILGYYFNRSRLKRAQDAESRASARWGDTYQSARRARAELLERIAEYDSLIERNERFLEALEESVNAESSGEDEDGEV